MARYDRGYDRSPRPASGDWATPYGSRRGMAPERHRSGERPWVGGYRDGYQGGSSGIPVGDRGYMDESGGARRYDRGFRGERSGYDRGYRAGGGGRPRGGYGGDYWWLGERAFDQDRARSPYDAWYRRFEEENRPRFSPVGGNYHAMGGEYMSRRPPEPLREERWFSDWTRWF
jgi:hypothetical protein